MTSITLLLIALGLGLAAWLVARAKAWSFQKDGEHCRLAARPNYHAWYVALWVIVPLLAFTIMWAMIEPQLVTNAVLASPAAQNLPQLGFERDSILRNAPPAMGRRSASKSR